MNELACVTQSPGGPFKIQVQRLHPGGSPTDHYRQFRVSDLKFCIQNFKLNCLAGNDGGWQLQSPGLLATRCFDNEAALAWTSDDNAGGLYALGPAAGIAATQHYLRKIVVYVALTTYRASEKYLLLCK
jgi:hypothetical protein